MNIVVNNEQRRFWTLVIIVSISGFSQGMLLPLISIIFETDGISSTLNGLNATGLYIGTLFISPFVEQPLRKFGYKPIIIVGGAIVFTSLLMFPLWKHVVFWFILRLLIGIGDHCLHFATQTWLTSSAPQGKLGKSMAIYGLSFGVGFAVGPLMTPLIRVSESFPFIVSSILCLLAWSLVFFIQNEHPEVLARDAKESNSFTRYRLSFKYAWIAFLPPFAYGVLETSIHALFPVYALRMDYDLTMVSFIISAFSIGGIITQVPLGLLGDRIGRRNVLLIVLSVGTIGFGLGSFLEFSEILIGVIFFISGMFLGSSFSLGITYMADLTPKELLPTGNLLCGIFFSLGSLMGPFIGGLYLQVVQGVSFLVFMAVVLLLIFLTVLLFGKKFKVLT